MNENFETGVVKLQRGKLDSLTDAEKAAVRMLKVEDYVESTNAAAPAGEDPSSMEARLIKKRRVAKAADKYMPCGFILGSAAAVERIWSVAKRVIGAGNSSMSPELVEALLFLRYNERFWDVHAVSEAYHGTKSERNNARVAQLEARID